MSGPPRNGSGPVVRMSGLRNRSGPVVRMSGPRNGSAARMSGPPGASGPVARGSGPGRWASDRAPAGGRGSGAIRADPCGDAWPDPYGGGSCAGTWLGTPVTGDAAARDSSDGGGPGPYVVGGRAAEGPGGGAPPG